MSRYSLDPPDEDRYSDKPVDAADVPRDGEPWMSERHDLHAWVAGGFQVETLADAHQRLQTAMDPAEHATHAILDAIATLEQEILKADQAQDLTRAHTLKQLTKQAYAQAERVDRLASATVDAIVERRR